MGPAATPPALGALTKNILEAQQRYQAAGALGGGASAGVPGTAAAAQAGALADAVQGLSQLVAQAGRCLDRLPEDVEAMAKEYAAWAAARAKDAARLEEEQRCVWLFWGFFGCFSTAGLCCVGRCKFCGHRCVEGLKTIPAHHCQAALDST